MKVKLILIVSFLMPLFCYGTKPRKEVFAHGYYGTRNAGTAITVKFERGKEHNHPLFAVWLTDVKGNFIHTLYVSESVGRGFFKHVSRNLGKWQSGEIQRPASLPFWAHNRGVVNEFGTFMPTPQHPEVDAYTGATPPASFILHTKTEGKLKGKYKIWLELNQSWDWNEFWTNDKYPSDVDYLTSSQPALVYQADIDASAPNKEIVMLPVGHSHYAGADGKLYPDLSTFTTALKIAKVITVVVE